MKISGWGRYPVLDCNTILPREEHDLIAKIKDGPVIARGNGRSYGDSSLNTHATLDMSSFNRMLSFDPEFGVLAAEAGVLLADIIQTFLPRGWFPAVTPGTKFVTLGGMIAADVHGKNHHRDGSVRNFVDWLEILTQDGTVQRCSDTENRELFDWTFGSMGLTGIILRAAIRLRPVESAWIRQKITPTGNLSETITAFQSADSWTYSVAWIDCLTRGQNNGRGLLTVGEHALRNELPQKRQTKPYETPRRHKLRIPFDFPGWTLNSLAIQAFNTAYYWLGKRSAAESLVDWDRFFYPLDAIDQWNRMYGRKGFIQFQCMLPPENADTGLHALLAAIAGERRGSFLAVLKRFGSAGGGLSFPGEGFTLALDFPVGDRTLRLVDRLQNIAIDHGGRMYLAKDATLGAEQLLRSDTRVTQFKQYRDRTHANLHFQSAQSERLRV